MDILELFQALGAYFLMPFYVIAYFIESFINGIAVTFQIVLDSVFNILEGFESGLNSLLSFVSWLPSVTFWLLCIMIGLLVSIVLIRIVTKVIETLPGGFGGWLK